MAAILGLDAASVTAACVAAAEGEVVSPANLNAPGQVVIAGTTAAVQRAGAEAKARGAKRVIPLNVSAPFHCALMAPAQARLEPELRALRCRPHACRSWPMWTVSRGVMAPRRSRRSWRRCPAPCAGRDVIGYLVSAGVRAYVEVGPGTVLAGLVRKIDREARVVSFGALNNSQRWRRSSQHREARSLRQSRRDHWRVARASAGRRP